MASCLQANRFQDRLEWVSVKLDYDNNSPSQQANLLPKNAVAGGVTPEGEVTYVARVVFPLSKDVSCGGYIPSKNQVSMPLLNQSLKKEMDEDRANLFCEVLVCHDPEILYWVDSAQMKYGWAPNDAVTIGAAKGNSYTYGAYIGRTMITGVESSTLKDLKGLLLGRMDSIKNMSFVLNESEFKVTHYQALCAYLPPDVKHLSIDSPYTWVPASDGYIPENGLIGGKTEDGENIYVAKVDKKMYSVDCAIGGVLNEGMSTGSFTVEEMQIGYVIPSEKKCRYSDYDSGVEEASSSYEVLVPSNPSNFHWITYDSDDDEKALYDKNYFLPIVFRTKPGFPNSNCLKVFNYNEDLDLSFKDTEVLVRDKIPTPLQEFCRYAILDGTSGVPHRIDRLPIPENMKTYCQLRPGEKHHGNTCLTTPIRSIELHELLGVQ